MLIKSGGENMFNLQIILGNLGSDPEMRVRHVA
jgi:hypothetical protein